MGAEERGLRVARDDAQPLGVQLGASGKILAVEEPVGVVVELMPALVLGVERREEGAWVGRVDHDRALVLAAQLPERIDLGIVDRDEAAVLVAMAQSQGLVDLQALGSGLETRLQPLQLAIGPARLVDAVEVDQREGQESARMGLVERLECLLEPPVPAAVQVDDRLDSRRRPSRPGSAPPARVSGCLCLLPDGCERR